MTFKIRLLESQREQLQPLKGQIESYVRTHHVSGGLWSGHDAKTGLPTGGVYRYDPMDILNRMFTLLEGEAVKVDLFVVKYLKRMVSELTGIEVDFKAIFRPVSS